jgi:uncharacterized membrane protein
MIPIDSATLSAFASGSESAIDLAAVEVTDMTPSDASRFPAMTRYHRWLGWHATVLRRIVVAAVIWLIVTAGLLPFVGWELATVGGWDVGALTLLCVVWPIILRADASDVVTIATREDETRATATVLVVGASTASLMGVGFALSRAGQETGAPRLGLIAFAIFTVIVSWTVINTVFTLRYAHLHFRPGSKGIEFGGLGAHDMPSYRDFAYVAFTIGMTYQVSDTALRDPLLRRTVLPHALLAYLFGVVIVAGAINLVAGLIR